MYCYFQHLLTPGPMRVSSAQKRFRWSVRVLFVRLKWSPMVIWECKYCVQNCFRASNLSTTLCEKQSHLDFRTASDQGVRRRFQNRFRCPFRRSIKLPRGHQTPRCILQQRHPLPINSRDPSLVLLFPAFAHTRPYESVFGSEAIQVERESAVR